MVNINTAKELIGYCGIYCGTCGMYRGRVYAKIAQDFLEIIEAAGYPDELEINPKGAKPDFDFKEFLKGLEYFSKEDSGAYCQASCKQGGGVPCEIRQCVIERGLEMCYECKDFPCQLFSWTFREYPDKMKDYECFKKLGFEGWIRSYEEKAEKGYSNATRKCYSQAKNETIMILQATNENENNN